MQFSEFLPLYLTLIETRNVDLVRSYTMQLEDHVLKNREFALAFVEPVNITKIQQALVEKLGISPKSMMLKTRVANPHMRAQMMARAIKTAVERA